MDKLVAFFKNVWFRRAVAVLGWGYTLFAVWIAYLCFGYYFQLDNPTPLFVLYLFVNFCAAGIFLISRKQVLTQINAYVLPIIVFAILICGFGNWYIIIPPVAVMAVLFFANSSNETLKTVLGTMFLLMFVIGTVGYIGIQMFMGKVTFTGVDLNQRDPDYERLSDSGKFRVVRYFSERGDQKIQTFYIEETEDDIKIPLGMCKRVFGCQWIYTSEYNGAPTDSVKWITKTVDGKKRELLLVDSVERENPYLIEKLDEETPKSSQSTPKSLSTTLIKPPSDSEESAESTESSAAVE